MEDGNQTESTAYKTGLTFDLNSTKCSPQVQELVLFEEYLINLIKHLRFRKVDNKFQGTLAKDCERNTIIKQNFNCTRQNVKYVSS